MTLQKSKSDCCVDKAWSADQFVLRADRFADSTHTHTTHTQASPLSLDDRSIASFYSFDLHFADRFNWPCNFWSAFCRSICRFKGLESRLIDLLTLQFCWLCNCNCNSADYAIFDLHFADPFSLTMRFSNRFCQADRFLFLTQMPLHKLQGVNKQSRLPVTIE